MKKTTHGSEEKRNNVLTMATAFASIIPMQTLILRPSKISSPAFLRPFTSFTTSRRRLSAGLRPHRRLTGGAEYIRREEEDHDEEVSFELAVKLFNGGRYYKCHDVLEELWYDAEEPVRTFLHGVLQCSVGFHHLLSQNHRGAMLELGEGLCKLRKLGFKEGPFLQFEQDISTALEFIYRTQKELVACDEEACMTMDGSEESYRLLGSFAAGQKLYSLELSLDAGIYLMFSAPNHYSSEKPSRVKVPKLDAKANLKSLQSVCEYFIY